MRSSWPFGNACSMSATVFSWGYCCRNSLIFSTGWLGYRWLLTVVVGDECRGWCVRRLCLIIPGPWPCSVLDVINPAVLSEAAYYTGSSNPCQLLSSDAKHRSQTPLSARLEPEQLPCDQFMALREYVAINGVLIPILNNGATDRCTSSS